MTSRVRDEKLALARLAYPRAEPWILESACASLDIASADVATIEATLTSFLGPCASSTALRTCARAFAADARRRDGAEDLDRARVSTSDTTSGVGTSSGTTGGRERGGRAPARETRAVRFVDGRRPARGTRASSCVNCLACGKVYDVREKDGVTSRSASAFLESGGKCEHCGEYVEVTLADGTTRFRGGGETCAQREDAEVRAKMGEMSLDEDAEAERERAAAVAAKDRLVHFDKTSAKRTTVIDDQSEWYDIDGNAWLDEDERAELKRQAREVAEAAEEAKRKARTTWTLDLVGRKVVVPPSADALDEEAEDDERASEDALAAARAIRTALETSEALTQGGVLRGVSAAAETAREVERRVFVDPRVDARPFFLPAAADRDHRARATADRRARADAFALRASVASRVLDDDPFTAVLDELRDTGVTSA
ncbi:unnamed product [Ostreococcus tauri]|uniref:Unnamed product n=1 Tax=Ostreococcus tauri TaxID=70448 RepID=A0A090N2S9_OSTTA|nr:unnamed product [Ostreococcus tauri]CEF96768.1 unnamed product [Ostreococcus tauri]|eukprot:XP_022838287.1 unnamed product [Ostreococcus tauri]